jgi:hypothetical protein
MIQQEYETVESFVRYGPVERVRKARRDYLGVYPWRAHANGRLVVSSVKPHYREIVRFINDHLDAVSQSTLFNKLDASTLFYVVYWIVFLRLAVTLSTLTEYVQSLVPEASSSDIRNKLYCMELAG